VTEYTGWDFTEEDYDYAMSLPSEVPFESSDINEKPSILLEKPPSTWLKYEDQWYHPSCVGNALAAVLEVIYFYFTQGEVIQLSRWFAYIQSQKYSSGRLGEGQGAYISGAVKAGQKIGVCLESTVPYPRNYHRRFPPKSIDEAAKYRIKSEMRVSDYDSLRLLHEGATGAAIIGRSWGRGAHALAVIELIPDKKDRLGRPYVREFNSHKGNEIIDHTPDAYDRILKARGTVCVWLSDMPNIKPREYDYTKEGLLG